jgi:hypothetical protein
MNCVGSEIQPASLKQLAIGSCIARPTASGSTASYQIIGSVKIAPYFGWRSLYFIGVQNDYDDYCVINKKGRFIEGDFRTLIVDVFIAENLLKTEN